MTITINDVAREAGVSMATVSRVVNNNNNVKPQTKARVQEAIDRLGYRPNAVARGLASKKTTTVGVVIPDISNANYAEVARGIEDIADMYKYNIILSNADKSKVKEIRVINTLLEKQVDGMLFIGGNVTDEHIAAFASSSIPIVLCGTADEHHKLPSVDINHIAAAYDAVLTLIRQNHTSIALIGGPLTDPFTGLARYQGYRQALEKSHIPFNEKLVRIGKYTYESGYEETMNLLRLAEHERPSAVFAVNDEMAVGAVHAIQDSGLQVPSDVSVISLDDGRLTTMVRPKLTAVAQPLYDIGAVSMRLLTKLMNGEKVESEHVVLLHELKVKQSVGVNS